MPFTEFVTPLLKQDAASKAAFLIALPLLQKGIARAPGYKQQVYGNIIIENGLDIGPQLKPALAAEWEGERNLQDFLASDDFKDFGVQIKPLAAGPPNPQLYKTDVEPTAIFAAALMEVFRIPVAEEGKIGQIQLAWKKFVDAIKTKGNGISTLCGTSVNLEEKLFVGAIGYGGVETRENSIATLQVAAAKEVLEAMGANSFVVSYSEE